MSDFNLFIDSIKSDSDEEVEKKYKIEFLEMEDKDSWRPLHHACRYGRVELIKLLLSNFCETESVANWGYQPIHLACLNNHIDIVKLLITSKCDINASDKEGHEPIHLASINGHIDIVKILIENKCDTNASTKWGYQPIHLACKHGCIDIVELLIANKSDINASSYNGCQPIHLACKKGHIDIVKLLITKKCDINASDKWGYEPIHFACKNGHIDIVKLLIANKSDINASSYNGYQPIDLASKNGYINIVEILIENNCDINASDRVPRGSAVSLQHLVMKNIPNVPTNINLENRESVLSRDDDRYVTCKQRLAAGEELNETEKLIRQIKGILNRVVPQNFHQCLDDLVSLKIETRKNMTHLVNQLFLKAVKEEIYGETYAKLCYQLVNMKNNVEESDNVTFKSFLLQKCQIMFETPLEEQLEKVRNDWLLKAFYKNAKTKRLMESEIDEQIKNVKDRYYGNIRFIGELNLKGVVINKIIIFIIQSLLAKEINFDSINSLCKLLEKCGAKLDSQIKIKEMLNESFKKIRALSESSLESRVRFRILDILELRRHSWSLRKVYQNQKIQPKTLQEIKIEWNNDKIKEYSSSVNIRNLNYWKNTRLPNDYKSPNYSTLLGAEQRNLSIYRDSTIFQDVSQPVKRCGTRYKNLISSTQSINFLNNQCRNSSKNPSRSTSQFISKQKLSNSKLAEMISIDTTILSPDELLEEYKRTRELCIDSWNACSDKVEVVYQWLDTNFDTDCDNRISISNLLSMLINQNLLSKDDLLNAFSKLIESLEDLIIDLGQSMWNSLSDYFIPFFESMEYELMDIIERIFDFESLKKFDNSNACIIYSLPWSISNKIMKLSNNDNCKDIFKNALATENLEQLSKFEENLVCLISKNLGRAVNNVSQINPDSYLSWIVARYNESFNCSCQIFFTSFIWEKIFNQIQIDSNSATKYSKCFKCLSHYSNNNEIIKALYKFSIYSDKKGILSVIRCLIVTNTYDIPTVLSWESACPTVPVSSILKDVLAVIKTKSAFIF